jgi:two-component system response regulator PilR (NtrC family)
VRLLSATHKDLGALVNAGTFRHDLYYRINVIELRVPPLRERDEDLPQLATDILARLSHEQGRSAPTLANDAAAALLAYPFPGNVRELENILERALAMADGPRITAADLALPAPTAHAPGPDAEGQTTAEHGNAPLPSYIEDIERQAIEQALRENRYNKTRTAEVLGITYRALRYRLKKLGLD